MWIHLFKIIIENVPRFDITIIIDYIKQQPPIELHPDELV